MHQHSIRTSRRGPIEIVTQFHGRDSNHLIHPVFLERWSPRAFDGRPIPEDALDTFFEAARWAPSSYNSQPWRFLYARRDTPNWDLFLSLPIPFNQSWAKTASALVFVASQTRHQAPGRDTASPPYSHSFDAGAAWACLALQATLSGWATHGMTGFDVAQAPIVLNIPEDWRVEAAIAIRRRGDPAQLPETMAARAKPSDRLPLATIRQEGPLPG